MQQHQQHQRQQQRCPSRCLIILALMKAGLSEGFRFPVEPIPHVCNGGGGHLRGGASHQLVHPRTKVGAPCIPSPTDPTVFQAIDRPEEMLVKTDDETENEARGNRPSISRRTSNVATLIADSFDLIFLSFVTVFLLSPFLVLFSDGSMEVIRERGGEGERRTDRFVGEEMVFGGGCTRFRPPKAGEDSRWVLPGRERGEGRNPRC